jgi:hypothetical protein
VAEPKALPMQILDFATGFLMAFGASVALRRQAQEGGSWQVRVSLAQTGRWVRSLGRVQGGFNIAKPALAPFKEASASGFGQLVAMSHSARLSRTPAAWVRPSVPPGTSPPDWPSAK